MHHDGPSPSQRHVVTTGSDHCGEMNQPSVVRNWMTLGRRHSVRELVAFEAPATRSGAARYIGPAPPPPSDEHAHRPDGGTPHQPRAASVAPSSQPDEFGVHARRTGRRKPLQPLMDLDYDRDQLAITHPIVATVSALPGVEP